MAAGNGLSVRVLERSPEVGGQLLWTDAPIVDLLGLDEQEGAKIARDFEASARRAGAKIETGIEVDEVEVRPDGVRVLAAGRTLEARRVLLATGCRPRRLEVPGEEGLDRGFGARKDPRWRGRTVGVIGGGDEAFALAAFMASDARVKLFVRSRPHARPLFRRPVEAWAARGAIELRSDVNVAAIEDQGRTVVLDSGERVSVDFCVARIGVEPVLPRVTPLPARNTEGRLVVDAHRRTSVPELFAAGDLVHPPNERYIAVALADGALVARQVESDLTEVLSS